MEKVTLRKLFEISKFPFLNRIKKEAAVDLIFFLLYLFIIINKVIIILSF